MVAFGRDQTPGKVLRAAKFLAGESLSWGIMMFVLIFFIDELPIRLAHRIRDIDNSAHDLGKSSSFKTVRNWYLQSFEVCHPLTFIATMPHFILRKFLASQQLNFPQAHNASSSQPPPQTHSMPPMQRLLEADLPPNGASMSPHQPTAPGPPSSSNITRDSLKYSSVYAGGTTQQCIASHMAFASI